MKITRLITKVNIYNNNIMVGEDEIEEKSLDEEVWVIDSIWQALDVYSSDEFGLFEYKVKKCILGRNHDWTKCAFSHSWEKAQRRGS